MKPTGLVVEDDVDFREALCETLDLSGLQAIPAPDGEAALAALGDTEIDLVVSDVQMARLDGLGLLKKVKAVYPGLSVLLMTAYGTIQQAVDAMREGAVDYLLKPFEAEVLVGKVNSCLPAKRSDGDAMMAADPRSREVLALAGRVAQADVAAFITGESGTGKEVLARHIHEQSERRNAPFIAVNCAAIPENMLEAILFGYEKGAFTGAYKACAGKFEQAQGGTLLLDEVSEMDLGLQAKLLRVLQEYEVERLGGRETIALDLRVLATSNRDMRGEVAAGRFREDLYYRLNVFPIHLPPLRERRRDIMPLAEYLAARAARKFSRAVPRFSADAEQRLLMHPWPGNVRELDNIIQRTLVLAEGEFISAADIRFEGAESLPDAVPTTPTESRGGESATTIRETGDSLGDDMKATEYRLILNALSAGAGSRKHAAEQLGISPRTLRYKLARMREHGVAIPHSR